MVWVETLINVTQVSAYFCWLLEPITSDNTNEMFKLTFLDILKILNIRFFVTISIFPFK